MQLEEFLEKIELLVFSDLSGKARLFHSFSPYYYEEGEGKKVSEGKYKIKFSDMRIVAMLNFTEDIVGEYINYFQTRTWSFYFTYLKVNGKKGEEMCMVYTIFRNEKYDEDLFPILENIFRNARKKYADKLTNPYLDKLTYEQVLELVNL